MDRYLLSYLTDLDYFGVVGQPWTSALQQHQNHQNPLGIDPVDSHIVFYCQIQIRNKNPALVITIHSAAECVASAVEAACAHIDTTEDMVKEIVEDICKIVIERAEGKYAKMDHGRSKNGREMEEYILNRFESRFKTFF